MKQDLLDSLRCPYCWGKLTASNCQKSHDEELRFGILRCYCGERPVVAGIPIIAKNASRTIDEISRFIKVGRNDDALLLAVCPLAVPPPSSPALAPRWIKAMPSIKGINRLKTIAHQSGAREWQIRARHLLTDVSISTATQLLEFFLESCRDAFDYFKFRFGQPRHLVALSLASVIRDPIKPVLDLACGYGHITRHLVRRGKRQRVIGVDPNFFGLYISKLFMAPEAEYVCSMTDEPLPFSDDFFSNTFCSDAFHYFQNKAATVRELKRVTDDNGAIILTWVHNSSVRLPNDGVPLSADGYAALLDDIPTRTIPDSDVLARYHEKRGPDLGRRYDAGRLSAEPTLSLVATRAADIFTDHACFETWPHAEGRLGLNPLYVLSGNNGTRQLLRTIPSEFYAGDHTQCLEYLPESVKVSSETLSCIVSGKRTSDVEELIRQCVVLDIPEKYC